jgi:hypothetical protein
LKFAFAKERQNCWPLANIPVRPWKRPRRCIRPTNAWMSTWRNCSRENAICCPGRRLRPLSRQRRHLARGMCVTYFLFLKSFLSYTHTHTYTVLYFTHWRKKDVTNYGKRENCAQLLFFSVLLYFINK